MKKSIAIALAALLLAGCSSKTEIENPSYVWIDAPANFQFYGNSRENIAADCERIAGMGFTDIIVDVRPTGGDALFRSSVVPPLTRMPRWNGSSVFFIDRTADWDYLEAFIEEGHKAGLRVNAGVNMMVGGWKIGETELGMVYERPELRDWVTVDNTPGGLMNQIEDSHSIGARFLDPANPEVQEFLLTMLGDLASYKGLDGIVMDRCRYDDYALDAGYTDCAKKAFTEYLGSEPENWPVFTERGQVFLEGDPTPEQRAWLTFRCKTIHDFVARAASKVHSVAPRIRFGVYVGAWFSEYYRSGVNWTSSSYDLAANEPTYSWATPEYQATGFADLLDFMFLGAYTAAESIHGEGEWTMEGFSRLGHQRLCDVVPFAAGPDIGNGAGFERGGREDLIPDIVSTCLSSAGGLFIFDLCHIRLFNYWDAFRSALTGEADIEREM